MKIDIDARYCKGCNICVKVCPKNIFENSQNRSDVGYLMPFPKLIEDCIACGLCERLCPDLCISVEE